jgi:N-acetylglutamate synthase-like GNAT family acetyltransferase
MNISIRKGTEEDFPAILNLIKELAAFEQNEDKVTNSIEKMKEEKDLF